MTKGKSMPAPKKQAAPAKAKQCQRKLKIAMSIPRVVPDVLVAGAVPDEPVAWNFVQCGCVYNCSVCGEQVTAGAEGCVVRTSCSALVLCPACAEK